jgi:hypothetical protein
MASRVVPPGMERAAASRSGLTSRIAAAACAITAALMLSVAAGASAAPRPTVDVDLSDADRCDFIGEQQGTPCLLPFPNDYYTVRDDSTGTGRRLNLKTAAMPANVAGDHINAAPYNASDGFSPGQMIVVKVPGLDSKAALERTGAVPINHIGRYRDPNQPIVVLDAETGERWPIWAEIDSNSTAPGGTALLIHAAKNFAAGHRYIVALRNLKTASGSAIEAPEGFRYFRDKLKSDEPLLKSRRQHFNKLFHTLRKAGIEREGLYLAWDFTVASDLNIAGRALHMRDDAFASLGDTTLGNQVVEGASPQFQVTQIENFTPAENSRLARRVTGTVTVPCYLEPSCAPGGTFDLDSRGLPTRNGTWQANFVCVIPRAAVDAAPSAVRPIVYGHGLFGGAGEVNSGLLLDLANTHGFVICATDEIGMSASDVAPVAFPITQDVSNFPKLADRLQQGLLNELYLGRTMIHADGFSSHPAFHVDETLATPSVIDRTRLYYNGNSQGGIMGGALTALSPDFTQAALGVAAMRYSLLLPRAKPFDPFAASLYPSYPDELERPLILSLIQILWDRGDPNGYAHRMTTDPLPDTPPHRVLINVALGDHQVTNFASDVEARTIGARAHVPVLDPGRWPDVDVLWGVPPITQYPFTGSAIFYWDTGPVRPDPDNPGATIGVPPPPLENVPNRAGEDPHGAPRGAPQGLELISQFLSPSGAITDVCGGDPCYAGGWTGL